MATGRYFTQTDFRQFNLNFPWAERTSVALQTTGLILLNSVEYDAVYRIDYDVSASVTGYLSLYGTGFVKNASNHLTAGVVEALYAVSMNGAVAQSRLEGVSVSAVTLHNALRTAGLTDDQAILRSLLRGNDNITFSPLNDYAFGYTGNDTLYGEGGNDQLLGQVGDDALAGGSGNDRLTGGAGADRMFGGYDSDVLRGNSGNDQLKGNQGSESTADVFEFRAGDGVDTILDWDDGADRIRLYGVTSASQVSIVAVAGGDVRITALDYAVVVLNADVADFQVIRGTGLFVVG